jgi:hypothetical protein
MEISLLVACLTNLHYYILQLLRVAQALGALSGLFLAYLLPSQLLPVSSHRSK